MTTRYNKQKNKLILLIVSSLFIFIATTAFYIFEKEKKHIHATEKVKLQTEIELLGEFLTDSILRRDYSQARNYLSSWIKKSDKTRKLEVVFSNGFKLFEYKKDCSNEMFAQKNFTIANKQFTIYLSRSVYEMKKHMMELQLTLILTVVVFTLLIGFILWFILSYWILKPLQGEIESKTSDLNEKKEELQKINRSYQALSSCNIALLEAKSEQELLDNICKAIYAKIDYKLVWIGYCLDDEKKSVKVMAHMGEDDGYLQEIDVYWSESDRGDGPTGRSIKEQHFVIINDTQNDPSFKPWKESAKQRGYYSCAGIPIVYGDKVFGAITLYSGKIEAFLEEEITLLEELASNLAFGIVSLRQRQEIEKSSITDGLTGIYNRRFFDKKLVDIIDHSKRDNQFVSFVMLDVDFFKQYNDNYGHQEGDMVLKEIACALAGATKRVNDYCFRLGGEEFGVIFISNSKENANSFVKNLKEKIDHLKLEHNYSSVSKYVTVSIGHICSNAMDIENKEEFYKKTDSLLYQAKEAGRDRIISN